MLTKISVMIEIFGLRYEGKKATRLFGGKLGEFWPHTKLLSGLAHKYISYSTAAIICTDQGSLETAIMNSHLTSATRQEIHRFNYVALPLCAYMIPFPTPFYTIYGTV